ncbi:hypothetical protein NY78_3934 [Desulfovibrio sp. TomC]|nr:hypothetical protein NY78_3934 [Desulfovibrio sp. TomC]
MTCPGFAEQLKLEQAVPDASEGVMRKGRFTQEQRVGIVREADIQVGRRMQR